MGLLIIIPCSLILHLYPNEKHFGTGMGVVIVDCSKAFFAKKEVKITTFGLAFQAKKALNSIVEGHFEAMAFEVTASP